MGAVLGDLMISGAAVLITVLLSELAGYCFRAKEDPPG